MMSDNENNERAFARMARASWGNASRGARRRILGARAWVRAEHIEARIKEHDARSRRRGARALTDSEVSARAFGSRTMRALATLAVPSALALYPPYALTQGEPGWLLVWPLTYAFLAWDGWAHKPEADEVEAVEQPSTSVDPEEEYPRPLAVTGLAPTGPETAILKRIESWAHIAPERRLQDLMPGGPVIDESGVLLPITLAGQWTPGKFIAAADQVRALLAVPDEVRTQIKPGGTADRAQLRIRTRIRDLDLTWSFERDGLGLDADTGEVVSVDVTDRILVAGMSGAGKSIALRVLMAAALRLPHTVLVIIDLKVEGALWAHTARVDSEPSGIERVVQELMAEMREREDMMRAQQLDKWEPTDERPRIVVVVDEGAELISEVDTCITGLRSIARRARSAEIVLWWATQKPTVTGPGRGLDSAISAQLTSLVCLAVASPMEARTVLGEDATGSGWHADNLQKGGWALVRVQGEDRAPDPTRVWFMEKHHVKALPEREPWGRDLPQDDEGSVLDLALVLSEGRHGVSTGKLAQTLGVTDVEVHMRMREFGVTPEPNAFAMGDGTRARGYRRSALEAAKNGRS